MNLINTSFSTLNLFRTFNQTHDALDSVYRLPFNLDTLFKVEIATVDFLASIVIPTCHQLFDQPALLETLLPSLQLIEGGVRFIELSRSCYLLYANPPGLDRQAHQLQIFWNMLNITRLALQTLNSSHSSIVYVRLAVQGLDSICRVSYLSQQFDMDFLCRAVLEGVVLTGLLSMGKKILFECVKQQNPMLSIATGVLLGFLTLSTKQTVSKIFDYFDIQPSLGRELSEWTFTIVSAASVTAAAMVGFRISQSIPHSLFMTLGTVGLGCSLGFISVSLSMNYELASGNERVMSWRELLSWSQCALYAIFYP